MSAPTKLPWRTSNGDSSTWYSFTDSTEIDLALTPEPGRARRADAEQVGLAGAVDLDAVEAVVDAAARDARAGNHGDLRRERAKSAKSRLSDGRRLMMLSLTVVPMPVRDGAMSAPLRSAVVVTPEMTAACAAELRSRRASSG